MQTDISYKPYGYIYKITNPINDKCYIGQTIKHPELNRWKKYKSLQCKTQVKLYNALKKYGPNNFIYEILDTASDQIVLDYLEDFYIESLDTRENGYNCKGGGAKGKYSAETRLKMSKSQQGRVITDEHRRKISASMKGKMIGPKNPMYGKHNSGKLNGRFGKPCSEELKQRLSDIQKGTKSYWYGRKHTDESKLKMSLAKTHPLGAKVLAEGASELPGFL
ncbi:MAG: NUMOD3 domain-containing DNA-binding protein [Eubacteriales bacterium]|nr:NUMOD3 domain-containing DNA-binding protein [Eubacteriales bacterium]